MSRRAETLSIEEFAAVTSLDIDFVSRTLHQYFMNTKAVTKEFLRQELVSCGVKGLLKQTTLIEKILMFFADSYNKFTAEG